MASLKELHSKIANWQQLDLTEKELFLQEISAVATEFKAKYIGMNSQDPSTEDILIAGILDRFLYVNYYELRTRNFVAEFDSCRRVFYDVAGQPHSLKEIVRGKIIIPGTTGLDLALENYNHAYAQLQNARYLPNLEREALVAQIWQYCNNYVHYVKRLSGLQHDTDLHIDQLAEIALHLLKFPFIKALRLLRSSSDYSISSEDAAMERIQDTYVDLILLIQCLAIKDPDEESLTKASLAIAIFSSLTDLREKYPLRLAKRGLEKICKMQMRISDHPAERVKCELAINALLYEVINFLSNPAEHLLESQLAFLRNMKMQLSEKSIVIFGRLLAQMIDKGKVPSRQVLEAVFDARLGLRGDHIRTQVAKLKDLVNPDPGFPLEISDSALIEHNIRRTNHARDVRNIACTNFARTATGPVQTSRRARFHLVRTARSLNYCVQATSASCDLEPLETFRYEAHHLTLANCFKALLRHIIDCSEFGAGRKYARLAIKETAQWDNQAPVRLCEFPAIMFITRNNCVFQSPILPQGYIRFDYSSPHSVIDCLIYLARVQAQSHPHVDFSDPQDAPRLWLEFSTYADVYPTQEQRGTASPTEMLYMHDISRSNSLVAVPPGARAATSPVNFGPAPR